MSYLWIFKYLSNKAHLAIDDWNPVSYLFIIQLPSDFSAIRITKLKTNHPSYNATAITYV